MSNSVLNQCWPLKMPPTAKAVLISMADQADDAGHCWPSIHTLSDRTCVSKRAVIDAIKWLERSSALAADRTNGRHTKYQLTPADFDACPMQSNRSETRKTSADAAPVPVQMPHQCSRSTSANAAPTSADAAPVPVQMPHQPVQMPHTNHQEPPIEPSITPKPRVRKSSFGLPDGFAEFWAQYPKKIAKPLAAKSWSQKRLDENLQLRATVMAALSQHCKQAQWTKDGGQYVPHASTWLNQERWMDEVVCNAEASATTHGLPADHPLMRQAAVLPSEWWKLAGFETEWDAKTQRCWWNNYTEFRNGTRIRHGEGATA